MKPVNRIQPIRITYVTSKDETTITYNEYIKNKPVEKFYVLKGRFDGRKELEVIEFLEKNIGKTE
jgi:hypothetical protein